MQRELIKNKLKELSVLFVDDEKIVIDIMKEILPMLFKETYYATDGFEGLKEYKDNLPDLVITDLSMPKLDGLNMIKHIKTINENVKIICISGHNEDKSIQECKKLGCAYIVKPINSKILFKVFEEILIT